MKNILILSLFFISSFFLSASADFLPEANDVGTSSISQEFENVNDVSTSSFNVIESNSSVSAAVQPVEAEESPDKFGNLRLDLDLNVSSGPDLKAYSDATKKSVPSKGGALFQSLGEKIGGVDAGDMESLKSDYITSKDANSSEARAIFFNQRFYEKARSLVANLATIECYVTRKLVNSYYCPLPGMENSFFKGGAAKDSNDEAKKECEELCNIPVSCLHKSMDKDIEAEREINTVLGEKDSQDFYIDVDNLMLPRYVEVTFSNKYLYDDNVSFSSDDYNASRALLALQESNHGDRITASYLNDDNETWTKIENGYDLKLNNISNSIKVYFPAIRTTKIKITTFNPYVIDSNATEKEDSRLQATLSTIKIKYASNNWWFCPEINIVSNAEDCSGEIKNVTIGSEVYHICVEEGRQKTEPTYGAFFTQSACEVACKTSAECVPTYKHLANIDPYNLPSTLKDVEVGCVDDPSNTSCTQELCMEYFENDTMPYLEKSWTNDDQVVTTVSAGIPSQTTPRPRIDIDGGISANGDDEARTKIEIKEMAEISYMNMLKSNSYDVSKYTIGTNIPPENAYELLKNSNGSSSLIWKMRPYSFDIDNNESYYIYVVFDIFSRYKPIASVYKNDDGTIPDWLDRTFVLKTPMSYKIVRRVENYEVQTWDDNRTVESWNKVDSMILDKYETFNGFDFSAFDINSDAEYYQKIQFSSSKNWEEFTMYNSIEEVAGTPGVLFHSQNMLNNGTIFDRVFTGDIDLLTSANFYSMNVFGVYSKDKLSYKELFDIISGSERDKHLVYSTITATNQYLHSNGAYDLDRTKMYISGKPDNMSVKVDFTPLTKEEGKKAFIFMLLYDDENASN